MSADFGQRIGDYMPLGTRLSSAKSTVSERASTLKRITSYPEPAIAPQRPGVVCGRV